jgi:hypothetical protein
MQEESKISYEGQNPSLVRISEEKHTDFADRLVQWGIAPSTEQANRILLGIVVVAIMAAMFLSWNIIFGTSAGSAPELPIPVHTV